MQRRFDTVALAGVGLIGGSLSLAARQHGWFGKVIGLGRRPETLQLAQQRGIVDAWTLDPAEAVRGAELVVLAVPLRAMGELVAGMRAHLAEGAIVTDVGSVKEYVHASVEPLLPRGVAFVGGHPIAGTEKSGPSAADPELFRGRTCVLTRGETTTQTALETVAALWQQVGMRVVELEPAEHDRILAWVSHLPHFLAFAAAAAVHRCAPAALPYAGPSYASLTRVAASSAETWVDIFLANAQHLEAVLDSFLALGQELRERIHAGDAAALRRWLEEVRVQHIAAQRATEPKGP